MPDFNSLVGQYLSAYGVGEQKKADVAATSGAKMATVVGNQPLIDNYQVGAGVYSGKGLKSAGQLELDVRTLSPIELNQKYGYDVGTQLTASKAQGMENFRRDASASGRNSNWDLASGAGLGLANGIAGIGALGVGIADWAGVAPDGSGAYVAKKIGQANAWAQSKQSDVLNDHRIAYRGVQDLDQRDHLSEQGDGLVEALKRIGKDAISSVANGASDPTLFSDGVANGAGSMLGGGVISKGVKILGGAAGVAEMALGASVPSKAAAMLAGASEKAAMPLAIGGMEAGGAYQQTAQQAVEQGADPEKANAAGLLAAAVQFPVALATGKLVSKFESSPFHVPSVVGALGNVAKEGVEEGVQSASGQLAQNLGVKTFVDPNQDLAEGVGEQAGQGALYGMGTAGAFQAPGTAADIGLGAARVAGKAAMAGVAPLLAREGNIASARAAEDVQQATASQDAAVAAAPQLHDELQAVVQAKGGDQAPELSDYLTKLFDNVRFDPAEAQAEAPVVQNAVQGATDRFTALRQVAQTILDPETSEADKIKAGAYIMSSYEQHQGVLDSDLREAVQKISEDDPALPKLVEFANTMNAIKQHPEIQAALHAANAAASSPDVAEQFTDKAMSTPEGVQSAQDTANAVIELASADPTKVDPAVLEVIRAHSVAGTLNLTPEQKSTLNAAYTLIQETKAHQEQKKALGLTHADRVTAEIQTDDRAEVGASEIVKKSAHQHASGVMSALRSGDLDLARERLQDFMLFSQHMQNKVTALNASQVSGTNEPYSALSPNRDAGKPVWFDNTKGLGLKLHNEGSVKFAQQTALDARAVANLANGMATAFPQLEVPHVSSVPLQIDPELTKKAAQIVRENKLTSSKQSGEQVKSEEVPAQVKPQSDEPTLDKTEAKLNQEESAPEAAPAEVKPEQVKPEATKAPEEGQTAASPDKADSKPVEQSTPEPVQESPAEPEADAHSALLGSKDGKNWFVKAFKAPSEVKSRLAGLGDQVVETIAKAMSSGQAFMDLLGTEPSHKLTADIAQSYQGYLATAPQIQEEMAARLAKFLAKNNIAGARPENPAQQWLRGKVLNIVEDQEGQLTYNPELLQSAVLAGLQWLLSEGSRPSRVLDEQDVADLIGIDAINVTEDQIARFNQGSSVTEAKRALADTITRFWGVEIDRKAPIGYTKGIPEAVAAEVLKGMEAAGLIRLYQETEGQGDETKTFNRIDVSDDEAFLTELAKMTAFPGAIEQLALVEPREIRFIGEAPKRVAEFQMRNRLVRNTDQQKTAIKAEQGTPHFINPQMVSFLESLGKDLVLKLFGAGELDETQFNKNHALSLRGQNATIGGAYDALVGMLAEVRNKADMAGLEPDQMPIHYEYNVSRVGRLHMLGLHNPQSSKLMREAILPTRVTLDLTDKVNEAKFMLAVAQAWGEKVHKQPRSVSVEKAKGLAEGDFVDAMEALGSSKTSPEDLVDALKSAFGDKLSVAAVHAAMELSRFSKASEAEKKAFTTDLYVEADGVTDGPINALVHISTGPFSDRWVQLVAKGGLFLGSKGMTVNRFVAQGGEQARDLYQATTDAFEQMMGRHAEKLSADPDVSRQLGTLLETMNDLLGSDVSFDGQSLEIGRGIAKNPLTVTIYGSGVMGIADKVTGAVTSAFYEELSKAAQGKPNQANKLQELMLDLTSTVVKPGKEGLYAQQTSPQRAKGSTYQDFTLSVEQLDNLRQNVLHLFVTPLRDAIEATISDTYEGRTSLREAVQVQSIFLEHAFKKMVEDKLAEKSKEDRTAFLSQAELDAIYDELKAMSPLVETGTQTFFVAGSENADVKTSVFAKSLDDDLSTPGYVYGPKDAGVAGIPYMVIGPGDGQMMQNLSTMDGAPKGTLKVFDGVHLKLDSLDEDAVKVNQAVHEAWGNNPLSAVDASFQTFLQNVSFDDMSDDQVEALKRALFSSKERDSVTDKLIQDRVRQIGSDLSRLTQTAQARHNALSRVEMSVDHMASAEAPFQSQGESLEGKSEVEIAHRLNELMDEELKNARNPKAKEAVTNAKISPPAEKSETQQATSSVVVTPASGLLKMVQAMKIPAEQKNLLREIARSLQKSGWEVVQGTKEQLAAYALEKGQTPHYGRPGEALKGYTALSQQRIYLLTDESETLLHELIHASVTQKILDHYQGRTSPEVTESVTHLEELLSQWMAKEDDLSGLSAEQRQAYANALHQVRTEQNSADRSQAENQAAALDEFLAWNLSNEDLIKIAQGTKVENPFARVVKRVLIALKNLIWGRKMSPMVRSDMYSALRFNASVLINAAPTLQSRASAVARFQSVAYGQSDRLTDLHQSLSRKIVNLVKAQPDGAERLVLQAKINKILAEIGNKTALSFINAGFAMNTQEKSAFTMLMTVFASQAKLDPAALGRVQELYAYVNKTLKPDHFITDKLNPVQEYAAGRKLQALRGTLDGKSIMQLDDQERSTLLPAFLALAMVNDEFRGVLAGLDLPKAEKLSKDSLDNILTNYGNEAMDRVSRIISGEGRNKPNVQAAIDALTDRLASNVEEQENAITQMANPVARYIDSVNDTVVDVMQDLSKKGIDKLKDAQSKSTNKAVNGLLETGKGLLSIINEEQGKVLAEGWVSLANSAKVWEPARTFLNDLVGRTESNAPIFDLIKPVRSFVQGVRQQAREYVPNLIAGKFKQELSKEQWGHLFQGLAKTDLSVLRDSYSVDEILKLLADKGRRAGEIRRLEDLVEQQAGVNNWKLMQAKAQQLAQFLNTGEKGHHLLRNAMAVAGLFGVKSAFMAGKPSAKLIANVDQLVTLYAVEGLSSEAKDTLTSLVRNEAEGLSYTLEYLAGQRLTEQAKLASDNAKANHYKGYIPSAAQQGVQLVVAKDSERARLEMLGFKRQGDYKGSLAELSDKKGYYYAPLSSRSTFAAGIMQNVRQTASGVDPVTGFTHDGLMTAGRIQDPKKVLSIANLGSAGASLSGEDLMPIFDAQGNITAYERGVDTRQEELLNRDTHLARMIGVWRGRQAEEAMAQKFNEQLVERLHDIWTTGKTEGRANEFVDLFDKAALKGDPVLADAVSLFTPEALEHIKETFGGEGFMVRKDMINDAIGYRSASVGDAWTGNTRLNPKVVETARKLAVGVFGTDAYRNLVIAEKFTQNVVSEARQTIVVRSVIVPISNFVANIYQMTSRGVHLNRILRDMPKKLSETNAYVTRRHRQLELEADLRAAGDNVVRVRQINTELQSIEDANKRMSIWPLIEAGEFSSISEAGSLEKEELSLYEGKLSEYIEHKIDKLPKGLKDTVRYGLVTNDTALFQGMARAMEYGDFLAKAIRYDHLTQEKKMDQAQALASIGEEYINYDRLSGRFRTYVENMGMLWFYNFKVRSVKIALAAIRENPIHVLLTSLVPTPPLLGSVGTPLADNLFSMAADGSLGWSIGPGMGLRAEDMNPWINLLN